MRKKVTVIGSGKVGSQAAMIVAYKELADVVLWNRTVGEAKGIALDIMESSPIDNFDVQVMGTGDYKDTKNSDIVVITAGAQRKEGQSRDDLLFLNAEIVKGITENVAKYSKKAVIIVVTNPLDAMVWLSYKTSRFKPSKVIGMAGILDTSRYRSFIAQALDVSVEDVSAMVLGGHGDFMLPLPSHSSVNGVPVTQLLDKKKIAGIAERTRKAGEEIIKLESSSAFFSPAYSIAEMVEAILKDKRRVLPCAAFLNGQWGLKDIFMGVPVKLGSGGAQEVIELELTKNEERDFKKSAAAIKALTEKLKQKYKIR